MKQVNDDAYEEALLMQALKKGTLKTSKNAKTELKKAKEAATNYLSKNARISLRLSDNDLLMLKRRAASEGMPYQTLIASVLHKYVTGQLS
ncbi:MAG: hypothetical protein EBR02_06630 [Alphaproteobacteria bacterium]|nr:hypothetical protein [Alphaproteobacteria bacterium]